MSINASTGLSSLQIVGVIIAVLGLALFVYTSYTYFFFPRIGSQITARFNRSNFSNQSSFNSTSFRRGGFTAGNGTFGFSVGNAFSAILMILLGAVTFKYGELKKSVTVIKKG